MDRARSTSPADAEGGLVFGDIEDDEGFHTPLTASRASSHVLEDALLSAVEHVSEHELQQQQAATVQHAARSAARGGDTSVNACTDKLAATVDVAVSPKHSAPPTVAEPVAMKGSNVTSVDAEAASSVGNDGAQQLSAPFILPVISNTAAHQTAAAEESAEATQLEQWPSGHQQQDTEQQRQPDLQQGAQPWEQQQRQQLQPRQQDVVQPEQQHSSSLVTLSPPSQQGSESSSDLDDSESGESSDIEAVWAATEQISAVAGAPNAMQEQQQQQGKQAEHQQQHQQRQSTQDSGLAAVPASPVLSRGSLEKVASWQLQHAAAAAAGTAVQPAPPRSDMNITRLSSSGGSPASPTGGDGWSAWQGRRRHFFVLTAAGKPVFSRHGDEQALAGFMAVIQALVSVVADQGDSLQSMTVGPTKLVFLLRGQLYLVAVSSRGEPPAALRRQLELLYQSILMVLTGGVERLLQRSPGYDVHNLLAGSKPGMMALVSWFGDCPGWMMGTVEPAAATAADTQAAQAALQIAIKATDALYGVVLVGRRVLLAEAGRGAAALNVYDLQLLSNFANSNYALRHSESFAPLCLPNFQPNAFVHAYITCIEPWQQQQTQLLPQSEPLQTEQVQPPPQQQQQQHQANGHPSSSTSSIFVLLISRTAEGFHKMAAACKTFTNTLTVSGGAGVLGRVAAAAASPSRGRLKVESLPAPLGGSVGSTPFWHAIIRFPQRHQHITLQYPPQLFATRSQQKQLVRQYCRLFCAAHAQLLEQPPLAGSSSTGIGPNTMLAGLSSQGDGSGSSTGSSSTSSSIASIVGSSSTAAAAAAAAASYVLPSNGQSRPHKVVWVTHQRWVTGVLVDRDIEVYATFDPLTEKEEGLKLVDMLRRLFADKSKHQELLVPGL